LDDPSVGAGVSGDCRTSLGSDVVGALTGTNSSVDVPFVGELGLTSEAWRVWACKAHAVVVVSNPVRSTRNVIFLVRTEIIFHLPSYRGRRRVSIAGSTGDKAHEATVFPAELGQ
jgi:hypothetical protein